MLGSRTQVIPVQQEDEEVPDMGQVVIRQLRDDPLPNTSLKNALLNLGLKTNLQQVSFFQDLNNVVGTSANDVGSIGTNMRNYFNSHYQGPDSKAFSKAYRQYVRLTAPQINAQLGINLPDNYKDNLFNGDQMLINQSVPVVQKYVDKARGKTAKNQKYISRGPSVLQAVKAKTKYNVRKAALTAFPQWIAQNMKKKDKTISNTLSMTSFNNRLSNQNDLYFNRLGYLSNRLARYDPARGRWIGQGVVKQQNKAASFVKNYQSRMAKANKIFESRLTQEQAADVVPPFIHDIIKANTNLSKIGFGPISKGGQPLYAGRWLDNATGRVRVLPNASKKYINPLSKNQMVGFLQAKMLNHWNTLVSDYVSYKKYMAMDDEVYRTKAAKRIQSNLDIIQDQQLANKKITNAILTFKKNFQLLTPKNLILRNITTDDQARIFNMPANVTGSQLTQQQITELRDRVAAWDAAVTTAYIQALANLQAVTPVNQRGGYQYLSLRNKIARARVELLFSIKKTFSRGAIALAKAQYIPDTIKFSQLMNASQKIDQITTKLNRNYGTQVPTSLTDPSTKQQISKLLKNFSQIVKPGESQREGLSVLRKSMNDIISGGLNYQDVNDLAPRKMRKLNDFL